jgi:hypothetical protein
MTDFIVQDHGSLIILVPQTTVAKEWADERFPEDAANWANGTVIERCYFKPVYAGIIRDGLTIS